MFLTFFGFEIRYWLRGMMVWIFLLILTAFLLAATSSDAVQVGSGVGNTVRNSSHVIQNFYAQMSLLCGLMITAFVNSAASRDFAYGTSQILFTKPLRKFPFLMGRFWGSTLIALIPLLGISLGILLAPLMPWVDAQRYGPVSWSAHLQGILVFAIPNTLFVAATIFAVAVWTRSSIASFIAAILLLVAYSLAGAAIDNLDSEWLASLLDPFGIRTYVIETKYWTVAERTERYVTLSGVMLQNRLLWTAAGLLILGLACWRFSFAERTKIGKQKKTEPSESFVFGRPLPPVHIAKGTGLAWMQALSQAQVELWATIRSPIFIVIMLAAGLNMIAALMLSASEGFGLSALPVTYQMIDIIRGSMYLFLVAIVTFYSGVLVWKEREAKLDDVHDALPYRTPAIWLGKFMALVVIVIAVQVLGMLSGVAVQALSGYDRFQLGLYAQELLGLDLLQFVFLIVLAMFAHVVSPNKYLGYFLFIALLIANAFAGTLLDIESLLFEYGPSPTYVYSDLFGLAPFVESLFWFSLYGVASAALLAIVILLFWQRGRETSYRKRVSEGVRRLRGSMRVASVAVLVAWIGVAGWITYNTMVVNEINSPETRILQQVAYEKELKKHEYDPLPSVVSVKYEIELYPQRRAMHLKGEQRIVNRTTAAINTAPITISPIYETTIELENAAVESTSDRGHFLLYRFVPPLEPGEERVMTYTVISEPQGFENQVSNQELVQNGTFFNNSICPQFGYQRGGEVADPNARARHGMGPVSTMPELDPTNLLARSRNYLGSAGDWVDIETVISTSADQIAVAPGSLIEQWTEGDRKFFRYRVDHTSLNFYSFISARFKVAVQDWNGVSLEAYYHPEHHWNVDNMLRSMRASLEYYSEQFGPYRHKQARIIEFPRIATFAQAFPGTMPYSEGIGFIADLQDPDDIDMVYYVVAHEIAHQWWAHQVIGADMQGSTLLSETMAQYSALMVMEREFGRDIMRKFLQYEMDSYLRARGTERLEERPLRTVEANQGYVHYRKGSVVMYQLKELIGEERVNAALRSLVDKFAYQQPPYPTSIDLIDALRQQTPAEYHEVLEELFSTITLYSNRTKSAEAKKRDDGKYDVTLVIECEKYRADEKGEETEVPIDDWIEVGAFAAPEPGRRYGETLHRERLRVTDKVTTIRFTVDREPEQVGVDPFALLIDRLPVDNLKRPDLK